MDFSNLRESVDLFDVLFIAILVGVIFIGAYSAITAYLDYNSEKVEVAGTVTSSEVDRDSTRRGVSYDPEVQYEYTYNSQQYSSDNVKPGSGSVSMSRSAAQSIVSEYSEGDTVTVYVDRNDPSRSWLIDKLPVGSVATSGIISLAGLFILYKKHLSNFL